MKSVGNLKMILSVFLFQLPALAFGTISNLDIAYCDWESTLKSSFDIVETFDNLRDWQGGTGYHWDAATMPKKLDGSASIWTYYTNDMDAVGNWIQNHGSSYIWGSTGKSLCINYNNFVGAPAGYGPSRLGTFLGNGVTGKSGYKKIYVFFMVKFRPGFFTLKQGSSTEFEYVGTLKFFDICSGFTQINYWGTSSEHSQTCGSDQDNVEYGLNVSVINIAGGGDSNGPSLFTADSSFKATNSGSCWTSTYSNFLNGNLPNSYLLSGSEGSFAQRYLSGKWIGVEVAMDIGTRGNSDGSTELWLYDESGNVFAHILKTGLDKLVNFDHYYNKVTLGGNRFGAGYDQDPGDSDENRFYVDDFIIHGSRIGPRYFALRTGAISPVPPSPPTGLKVTSTSP